MLKCVAVAMHVRILGAMCCCLVGIGVGEIIRRTGLASLLFWLVLTMTLPTAVAVLINRKWMVYK